MTDQAHHHDVADDEDRTSVEHWDGRYSGEQVWSGNPNGALVAEVGTLTPGRALDVGCGEGADSVWLARQGWDVTALDISGNAVARTLAAAGEAGVAVRGMVSPLVEADLPLGTFDLVSAMYPVLARTPDDVAERRLLDLVAPGGTVLVVHHEFDPAHAPAGFDPADFASPDDVAALLDDDWEVVTRDRRPRHVESGGGAGHTVDIVVRARRLA